MSSPNTAPNQTSQGQEKEKQTDSPRGRTQVTDTTATSSQYSNSNNKQRQSRSVSRGRTHTKLPPKDRRGRDDAFVDCFVYPGLGGSFGPKSRRSTVSEAGFLSDAPHLDQSSPHRPHHKKRRASSAIKSPSHIRVEIEAMAEAAAARNEALGMGMGKAPEEGDEKE
ncbi:hypothetical protein DHEL01_v210474 [Diaporthe helianthi]|uniref:Uncharacterized protein n=1 Tax=Diaporthe helianthi TaxID=158607 RepID=A0A2P5HLM7_DIAHE|nr:hypothetical protein DHEL01_v210474 [Diaporthe helianthi]